METPHSTVQPVPECSQPARRQFQFRLRTLFIGMTGLAVLLSALFAGPSWVAALTALAMMVFIPMCLAIGITYGRGYVRTFSIGGMFPAGFILSSASPYGLILGVNLFEAAVATGNLVIALGLGVVVVLTIAFGFAAVGLRWLIEQGCRPIDRRGPSPSVPG